MISTCPAFRFARSTGLNPGAIAIFEIEVDDPADLPDVLRHVAGIAPRPRGDTARANAWAPGVIRLTPLGGGVDDGLIAVLGPARAQVMPHGGPRVAQRLMTIWSEELGGRQLAVEAMDPRRLYPEAAHLAEALWLQTLARTQSPMGVDLLLDQPRRWAAFRARMGADPNNSGGLDPRQQWTPVLHDRARSLRALIDPPLVVLAGRPNVGKSTLSNALLGREVSIAADVAGTTRDYVGSVVDLGGLVVKWVDTPGLRETADPLEAESIRIARHMIEAADLLIEARAPGVEAPVLPREPDLRVLLKADLLRDRPPSTARGSEPFASEADGSGGQVAASACGVDDAISGSSLLCVSARTGAGLADLVSAVRSLLVGGLAEAEPSDLPWLFDPRLLDESAWAPG